MTNNANTLEATTEVVISPEALLRHWQAHRGLTRRTIEAFPEDKLFNFSIGGMRPFAELVMEMTGLAGEGMEGMVTGNWISLQELQGLRANMPKTKAGLLELWDSVTAKIDELWPQLPVSRFGETVLSFGQWESPIRHMILYWIDNEIHHRAQGYVYLRALGIEPPPFWDRF